MSDFYNNFKDNKDYKPLLCHEDGVNYTGMYINGDYSRGYFNGDEYSEKEIDNKMIITYYDKELNVSYIKEETKDMIPVYKKIENANTKDISEEEFNKFVTNFNKKNDITVLDYLKSLNLIK